MRHPYTSLLLLLGLTSLVTVGCPDDTRSIFGIPSDEDDDDDDTLGKDSGDTGGEAGCTVGDCFDLGTGPSPVPLDTAGDGEGLFFADLGQLSAGCRAGSDGKTQEKTDIGRGSSEETTWTYRDQQALDLLCQALEQRYPGGRYAMALSLVGSAAGERIYIDPARGQTPFLGGRGTLAADGMYILHSLAVVLARGGIVTRISHESLLSPTSLPLHSQDISGAIAVARSLFHNLGVIDSSFAGVVEGESLDPRLLQQIIAAGGGAPAEGALSREALTEAHQAPWNAHWQIGSSSDGWVSLQDAKTCGQIQAWCEELGFLAEEMGDDCLLHLQGEDGTYTTTVNTATWDDAACRCRLNTLDTSIQDPAQDFAGVPLERTGQGWDVDLGGAIIAEEDPFALLWETLDLGQAQFNCFDEEPRNRDVLDSAPGDVFAR